MEATIEKVENAQAILQAVEVTATIDEKHHLQLDAPLPEGLTGRVRVIVIAQAATNGATAKVEYDTSELTEAEWLRAASIWHAEDFADEPDLYTIEDGQPFRLEENEVNP